MFSGIVEEIGRIGRVSESSAGLTLMIGCRTVLDDVRLGDSIAVDGVCLTVASFSSTSFTANIQPVTARRSSLGSKRSGAPLNLERSLALGGRIGGHYVQGHVDGVGRIAGRRGDGASAIVEIDLPPDIMRYVVERGFIAVDGASLTVMELRPTGIAVSLVAHTQQHITLPALPTGAPVNIETDVIARYVERLVEPREAAGLTIEALQRAGFA
ncbi:MAG TPA: riboflavin synthase [Thermomicrobiales bacterium]|nr:riboflavin synthase [Thermomicrobiales bacterium]